MKYRRALITSASLASIAIIVACAYPFMISHPKAIVKRIRQETPEALRKREQLDAWVRAGIEAMNHRSFSEAEANFQAAQDADPGNPFLSLNFAHLYDLEGRDQEALEAYERVLSPNARAYSDLQNDPKMLARYGDLCMKFSELDKARAAYLMGYERAYEDEKHVPLLPNASMAEVKAAGHIGAGQSYLDTGANKEAEKEFRIAASASPGTWQAHQMLGMTQALQGRRGEAAAAYEQAESLAPKESLGAVRRSRSRLGIPDSNMIPVIKIDGKSSTLTFRPRTEEEMKELRK